MREVKCRTLYNQEKIVPAEKMIQRPAAYALVLHDGKILLARGVKTGRYMLPGGGIEVGETNEEALIREVEEEAGIPIQVDEFLHFESDFFYYDPLEIAVHGFLFFYRCTALSTELPLIDYPEIEDMEKALWVDVASLQSDSFQAHGALILRLLEQKL